jgi:hypothetical protein
MQGAHREPVGTSAAKGLEQAVQQGSPGMASSPQQALQSPPWALIPAPQSGHRGGKSRSIRRSKARKIDIFDEG